MNKFKISQIQFQARDTPNLNAQLLKKYFIKTKKFKPDLICTPECSNIITNDKKYLFNQSTFQKDCPLIFEAKEFAKSHSVNIHLGSLLLKIEGKKKLLENEKQNLVYKKILNTFPDADLIDVKEDND